MRCGNEFRSAAAEKHVAFMSDVASRADRGSGRPVLKTFETSCERANQIIAVVVHEALFRLGGQDRRFVCPAQINDRPAESVRVSRLPADSGIVVADVRDDDRCAGE
jgi:hypothetical protein